MLWILSLWQQTTATTCLTVLHWCRVHFQQHISIPSWVRRFSTDSSQKKTWGFVLVRWRVYWFSTPGSPGPYFCLSIKLSGWKHSWKPETSTEVTMQIHTHCYIQHGAELCVSTVQETDLLTEDLRRSHVDKRMTTKELTLPSHVDKRMKIKESRRHALYLTVYIGTGMGVNANIILFNTLLHPLHHNKDFFTNVLWHMKRKPCILHIKLPYINIWSSKYHQIHSI